MPRNYKYIALLLTICLGCSVSDKPSEEDVTSLPIAQSPQNFEENDSIQLTGVLVCAHCFALNKENTGVDHELPESGFVKDCAKKCADIGYPIAVLSDQQNLDTKLWVIRTSASLFSDYMGMPVEVEGLFVVSGVIEPLGILVALEPGRKQILL